MRRYPARLTVAGTGSRMVITAPLRSLRLAAEIVPCIASTKPREIASPRPGAGADVVALLRAIEFVEHAFQLRRRNAVALVDDLQRDPMPDRAFP